MPPTTQDNLHQPTLAWIGDPPPAELAENLAAVARVVGEAHRRVDLVAICSTVGTGAFDRLPRGLVGSPVIAASPHEPTPAERMAWIKSGAEDLVSFAALPIAVARRIKRLRRERDSLNDLKGRQRSNPTAVPSSVSPISMRRRGPPLPRDVRDAPVRQPPPPAPRHDDFPPLMVPRPQEGVPECIEAWLENLRRYLAERDALLAGGGKNALERFLALSHLREQVAPRPQANAETAPSTLSRVHGMPDQQLGWPALIRKGAQRGRQAIEVAEARIISAGTDGLTLEVPFASSARQKLVMDLAASDAANAQFLVQARWQRRLEADRWLIGALILEMRIRELAVPNRT